jgi:hypothetical protein
MIFVTGPSPPLLDVSWSFTSDTPPKLRKTPGLHTANWEKSKCFLLHGPSVASFLSPSHRFSDFRTTPASGSGEHPGESDRVGTGFGRSSTTSSAPPGPNSTCNAPPTCRGHTELPFVLIARLAGLRPVAHRRDPRPAPRFYDAPSRGSRRSQRPAAGIGRRRILTAACCGCDRT